MRCFGTALRRGCPGGGAAALRLDRDFACVSTRCGALTRCFGPHARQGEPRPPQHVGRQELPVWKRAAQPQTERGLIPRSRRLTYMHVPHAPRRCTATCRWTNKLELTAPASLPYGQLIFLHSPFLRSLHYGSSSSSYGSPFFPSCVARFVLFSVDTFDFNTMPMFDVVVGQHTHTVENRPPLCICCAALGPFEPLNSFS